MKNRSRVAIGNPLRALKEVRDEPKEAAKGFALGVFFAMTPLVCIKVVLAVLFAAIFKWNKASTTIGVLTANPLTVPFIFSTAYFVGAAILGMDLNLDINTIFSQQGMTEVFSESKGIILAMSVGGTIVGLVAAPIAYYIAYIALSRRRVENQPALQPSPVAVD
jgi:hypothetical protein